MDIEQILKAYSERDDEGLCKALGKFHEFLLGLVYSVGPAIAMLQLRKNRLLSILNKISANADAGTVGERLALQAGAISTYLNYFEDIADRQEADDAVVRFSDLPDQDSQTNLARTTLLKCAFTHAGVRPKMLLDAVVRFTKVKKHLAEVCLKELLEMRLLEQTQVYESLRALKADRTVIHYRITRLGEAVLARRMSPYDIPLFFIDLAASDPEMRAAMKDEIKRTWPST